MFGYKKLKYLAYHDSLTGLLNRSWLYKNINKISCKFVYFVDINNLREVNKSGHTAGDEYIKNIINSIVLEKTETFVRYAGDEFILFSNSDNRLKNNEFYSVGKARNCCNLKSAIGEADVEMIKNKYK